MRLTDNLELTSDKRPQESSRSGKLIEPDEPHMWDPSSGIRLTLSEYETTVLGLRDVGTKERQNLAKKGQTFSNKGNYPIANCGDVKNARTALGRARPQDRGALRSYINRMAKKLGCNVAPLSEQDVVILSQASKILDG